MKTSAKILFGAAALAGSLVAFLNTPAVQAQPQPDPNNVCLDPKDVESTQAINPRTILFRMRDGSVWRNTLVAPCPWLVTHVGGFSQVVHGNRICANQQEITVVDTGNVCRLGGFTRESQR